VQSELTSKNSPWLKTPEGITTLVLGGATFIMGVPVAFKIMGRDNQVEFLRDLGFLSGPRGTAWAWVLALGLAVLYIAFTMRGVPLVARHWRAISWLKGLSILAAIVASIVEEAFFRRLIMNAVLKAGGDMGMQVAISGLTFGFAHGMWGLLKGSLHVALGAVIATTVMGAGLALAYVVGGRSLAPCIVAHFLITVVIEPGLMLAAVSGKMRR
jgi:hypothetical protein